jgi:hypothetical protein
MKPCRILVRLLLLVFVVAFAARPAHADRDQVQFGTNIVVPPEGSVHDAVCFFCSVNAQGTIDHDVVVFFGDVHIAGHANHDVVNFFGTVRADDNAVIAHDVVNFFGGIRLGENVSIGNDMVAMFGSVHMADSVNVAGNRVIQPAWVLLIPLLILGGIITLIVSAVRNFHRRQLMAAGYPFPPPPPPAPPAPPVAPQS